MCIYAARWMQLDCPSGAACRLEMEQCATGRQGEEGRGELSKYCCIQKGRHRRDTGGTQARAHCKGTGCVWHKQTGRRGSQVRWSILSLM